MSHNTMPGLVIRRIVIAERLCQVCLPRRRPLCERALAN